MAQPQEPSADKKSQSYDAKREMDARHTAVDNYTNSHLLSPSRTTYHVALEEIHQKSIAAGLPNISCSPAQAKFLMLQIQMSNAKHVLEVGTLGGYSAAWMATAGPDVRVTTIEANEEHANLAAKNVDEAGLASQIEILTGKALDVMPVLVKKVQDGQRPQFDFVFIDANKQDNFAYFNFAMQMTRSRAAIIVDNVVRNGKVASAQEGEKDSRVLGARTLVEAVGRDDRVQAAVIQTVGEKTYDGFLIAVKN